MCAEHNQKWYQSWFGPDYLLVYAHRNLQAAAKEVEFVVDALRLDSHDRILDASCGAGRHMRHLLDRKLNVIGADLSTELLSAAQRDLALFDVRLVRHDMQMLPFKPRSFSAVLSFFTSFGYQDTDQANLEVLKEARRVLKQEGYFLLDYLNPQGAVEGLVTFSEREVQGARVLEQRSFDSVKLRLNKQIEIMDADGTRIYNESVRLFSKIELVTMLEQAGFRELEFFGDFEGSDYRSDSKRLITVAS